MHNHSVGTASRAKPFSKWPAAVNVTAFIVAIAFCTVSLYWHFNEASDLPSYQNAAQEGWGAPAAIELNNIKANRHDLSLRSVNSSDASEDDSRTLPVTPLSESATCSSSSNMCPTFLLIGERKCGTSSLFHYIVQHSQVIIPLIQSIFDLVGCFNHMQLTQGVVCCLGYPFSFRYCCSQ